MRLSHAQAALILTPIGLSILLLAIATGRSSPLPTQYAALVSMQKLLIVSLPLGTAVYGCNTLWKRRQQNAARRLHALRATEVGYRLLAEHATDLITIINRDGSIRYASPSALSITGHAPAQLIGGNVCDYIHPDDMNGLRQWGAAIRTEVPAQAMFRLRHANGAWCWMEASSYCRPAHSDVEIVSVSRDISERRRLEAELLHLQRLDGIGRMAASVMHDINNFLTGIGGLATLGLQTLPPDHELRSDLEAIGHAAGRAATLGSQLLALARKPSFAPQTLDLNTLIHDLAPLLQRLLGPDIPLLLTLAHDLRLLSGDGTQLEQVILNLVTNARDAMSAGGAVGIETANLALAPIDGSAGNQGQIGSHIRLVISDTGCGMDAATQARMFEPYFTTKAPGQGSGLGLATCAAIIGQHRGRIQVESAAGHGTHIIIDLPCPDHTQTSME
jgi:PAS domain S-box-containing protein